MKNIAFVISLIVINLLFGCSNALNTYQCLLDDLWTEDELQSVSYVILIPNQGCGGCITHMENFYNHNQQDNSIRYVFTNVVSLKDLKNKIRIKPDNTIIDVDNKVLKYYERDKKIYPCILKLKNGKITNVYYQSPQEDGLSLIGK